MLSEFKKFMAQPFSEDMDATHWIAFIVLLGCAVTLWKIILAHITGSL